MLTDWLSLCDRGLNTAPHDKLTSCSHCTQTHFNQLFTESAEENAQPLLLCEKGWNEMMMLELRANFRRWNSKVFENTMERSHFCFRTDVRKVTVSSSLHTDLTFGRPPFFRLFGGRFVYASIALSSHFLFLISRLTFPPPLRTQTFLFLFCLKVKIGKHL